ncbi:MAG: repressor LexA [Elusimicrobia bacterium CG_4_10_14_0_8_um_filter_37_32]|nr:MAG: repressor LexA [Elusimicrobia bacterium CG02_land_8_20_14_3_00_37_13]PIZ13170.1 MAG: repressor LexA [Elusimicrobia bacterium CG_4_10_14_0_8_um_filter_37_32]
MQNNILTTRQQEILDFITKSINSYGFPPTIPEIQANFFFKSPNAVSDHLNAIAKKGYITRHPGKSRGIEVNNHKNKHQRNDNNTLEIPVVGRIAAGSPILAQENIEGSIFVDRTFIKVSNGIMNSIFALRIKGDSMKDAGIFDGDYVIIQKQAQVNQGEIAAVLIDDEATIKRVFKEKGRIRLHPENDSMNSIIIDPKEKEVSIIGKVKGVIRKI